MKALKKISFFFLFFYCASFCFSWSLYFTPNPETDQMVFNLIREAEKSLHMASYSFSWPMLASELEKKGEMDIRIITDSQPVPSPSNARVKIDVRSALFHPKFIVADNRYVVIGSGNFTEANFHLHHNHFLFLEDEELADFLTEKFDSWWNGISVDDTFFREGLKVYFSPENDCEEIIKEIISSASRSIHFAVYHFTSVPIAKALIKQRIAGVEVRGIIERFNIEPHSVFQGLTAFGCLVRKSSRAGFLHDKFLIVDRETIITGSYNFTAAARRNVEILVVIRDKGLADRFIREWERMWRFYSLP